MSGIPFILDFEVEHGVTEQVSPLIRRVVAANPSKFTFHGTGTYIIGRGEVAVVDPGPAIEAHADAILAGLEPGERITHILITHTHADHSPATRLLRDRGVDAPAYGFGPHGELPEFSDDDVGFEFGDPEADDPHDPHSDAGAGDSEAGSGGDGDGEDQTEKHEAADVDFVPDVVTVDGDVIVGAGWTVEAVHTPGHTSNHLCFGLREEKALFTGDHIMGWSTTVIGPPDGDLSAYLTSLDAVLARDDAVFWPTHGAPIRETRPFVEAYKAHRMVRLDQIRSELASGPATIVEMVPRMYAAVDKKLWKPAAVMVLAHLEHLVNEGEVVSDDDPPRRDSRWRLAG